MIHPLEPRRLLALAADISFGTDGRITPALGAFQFAEFNTQVTFLDELPDDKILVAGIVSGGEQPAIRLARYTRAGLLDTTFGGGDGIADEVPTPATGNTAGGAVQSDGKIIIGTTRASGLAVTRFNADGTLDSTFGGGDGIATANGPAAPQSECFAFDTALGDDGKIVVLGRQQLQNSVRIVAARFNPDGTPDSTFDGDGAAIVIADVTGYQVAAPPGGKILIVADDPNSKDALLVRLDDHGALDDTFDGDGVRRFRFSDTAGDNSARAIILDDGGKIVVGGSAGLGLGNDPARPAIARFNTDGSFDTTFGDGGNGVTFSAAVVTALDGELITDLARDNQGRYVAVGNDGRLLRFTSGGLPDTSFGPDGMAANIGFGSDARVIFVDATGRILVAGRASIARFTDQPRPEFERAENGTLIITLPDGDNAITIEDGAEGIILVTRNGVTEDFTAKALLRINILTSGGDDDVSITVSRPSQINLGDGDNTLAIADGNHSILSGSGADQLTLGDGDCQVVSGDGPDTITAGNGSVRILSGGGDDVIDIGGVIGALGFTDISAGAGDDIITVAGDDNTVNGEIGNDSILGGAGPDRLFGEEGDDTIVGGGGDDTVQGGDGNDTLAGGAGDDSVFANFAGGSAGDEGTRNFLEGGDGDDYLVGAAGRDTLRGGAQRDILIGNAGADLLSGGGGNDKLGGGGGPDRLYGGNGNDLLAGGNHNDRISGQGGDDRIGGERGVDLMSGGDGDDRFFTRDGNVDTLDGGNGDDTAVEFDESIEIIFSIEAA